GSSVSSSPFPYTTLFRSEEDRVRGVGVARCQAVEQRQRVQAAGGQLHLEAERRQPALQQFAIGFLVVHDQHAPALTRIAPGLHRDRKSTRLNSSHVKISY